MHAGRGRGKRLLYWFRTPPGVRVGRSPIDETAIRLLEQHNPDVQFDWTRILKAPPAPEGQGRREGRDSRDRDQRGRREARSPQRSRSGGSPPSGPPPRPVAREEPGAPPVVEAANQQATEYPDRGATEYTEPTELTGEWAAADTENTDQAASDPGEPAERKEPGEPAERKEPGEPREPGEPGEPGEPAGPGEPREPGEPSEPEERREPEEPEEPREPQLVFESRPEDVGSASYQRLGAEGLVRLRARYAEVMARIAERPLEEAAREELKQRAERLNPDGWVTADEVTAALEQYETVFEGLRGIVGRHPRQRRRGRR
jgi:hypothetical protein